MTVAHVGSQLSGLTVITSDTGGSSTVVEDGQLSEDPAGPHNRQDLVVLDNLQLTL